MQAVCLTDRGLEYHESHSQPSPGPGEALIRVTLAGICSTDLELLKGYFSFRGVLGHEFVGIVQQAGSSEWVGERVVSSINFADKQTPQFAEYGLEHHPQRTVLGILNRDGAMADYVCVPADNLYRVPDGVPDESAVFTEPLAAALRIADQLIIRPGSRACVIGPGRLGMLIGKVLSLGGCEVTMLGRTESSLTLARQWGLDSGLVESGTASSFDLVAEATGNSLGLEQAIRLTKPLGTLVMKSTYADAPAVDLTKIVVDEIKVVGSRCGPFRPALRLLDRGAIDVQSLIDGRYSAKDATAAFEHAARSGVRKILLRFAETPS